MTSRALLIRGQLERLIAQWRTRAEDRRRGNATRYAYAECADELSGALVHVSAEISDRAAKGWQTRRKNERKRKRSRVIGAGVIAAQRKREASR